MFYMIPNSKDLGKFKEELILPLKGYSIGFDVYFDALEIKKISKDRSVSVIINKFLHKNDINSIKDVLKELDFVKYFFVEDLGLLNLIDRKRIVLSQSHIITNYDSVNYFKDELVTNVLISNELTVSELMEIRKNTSSNLFYYLINRNTLMYSKRHLISSYYEYKNISGSLYKTIRENVSKRDLIIKEEVDGTLIFDKNIFSANKYLKELSGFNFIVNFSNLDSSETEIILDNYFKENLSDFISTDDYFLS